MNNGFLKDLAVFGAGIFVSALAIDSQIDGMTGGAVAIFALLLFLNGFYAALFKERGKMPWFIAAVIIQTVVGYLVAIRFL